MKITIDNKMIERLKISKEQFFYMLSLANNISNEELDELLNTKFLISQNISTGKHFLTHSGVKVLNEILIKSQDTPKLEKDRIEELTKELQNLYPKGRKPGTNNYWRGNFPEIRDRLINFFKKVGEYPNDLVIQATKNYIDSFQGDTRLMKTLKYFISKKRMDGNIEYDLLTFIENMDSKDEDGALKTTRLI